MKGLILSFLSGCYRAVRPLLFLFDSETIHTALVATGEAAGGILPLRKAATHVIGVRDDALSQTVAGIHFENPIGLSAGFDYRAQLMDALPMLGMGFGTVGTITAMPYEGNPAPRLGRLVASRSLLVNKGFKNEGIDALIEKTWSRKFEVPVGLSLGKTNRRQSMGQEESVADVAAAFTKAIQADLPFSYYELNISCPNLFGSVTFYPPENLRALLDAIAKTKPNRPVFVKMPITESDEAVRAMLAVIADFPLVNGVIFGNLWKDRSHPAFNKDEIAYATRGNFSGAPTWTRSNQLIRLAYREFSPRFVIIGCGGAMSAHDAYTKIRLGASLVQIISGLIFEGPQLPAQINYGLLQLLRRDGFSHIEQARGVDAK